jgi:hypothetical protein
MVARESRLEPAEGSGQARQESDLFSCGTQGVSRVVRSLISACLVLPRLCVEPYLAMFDP